LSSLKFLPFFDCLPVLCSLLHSFYRCHWQTAWSGSCSHEVGESSQWIIRHATSHRRRHWRMDNKAEPCHRKVCFTSAENRRPMSIFICLLWKCN